MSDVAMAGRTPALALEDDRLTPEQQAIVEHGEGPALVFAVAGAGKTTSMVHRIRRLVEEGADAKRILASSFSRSTVDDLQAGLDALGVRGVDCRTLHSLGRSILADAERKGYLPRRLNNGDLDPASMARVLAAQARTKLAMRRSVDTHALGIAQADLEDQISAWKTQLAYADLASQDLPDAALDHATQAEHDNDDYLTLYRIAEALREERGWITFDDMLREGWEALLTYDDVCAEAQARYQYVLVDEFQDVSPVQARLLDVLTEPHRNYMAIGDDDQCIYEWRGADPSFILDFADRYEADEYVISDNFRSTGQQTSLANAVISENTRRREKRVHLTRSFTGHTRVERCGGPVNQGQRVVQEVQAQMRDGRAARDLVILVRQYAQTPFIEQSLIEADVPYRVVGNRPFYLRRQVQALLRHLFFGTLEAQVRTNGWLDDRRTERRYLDRFEKVLLEPNRYVSGSLIRTVKLRARREKTSILDVLHTYRSDAHERTQENIDDFLEVMDALVERLDEPAHETVEWLIGAIGYEGYIRRTSAFKETADDRIRTARSLVHFAKGLPTTHALLDRVKQISFGRMEQGPDDDCLEIRSIHRAKGGEWPVVMVPGCDEGTLPNLTGEKAGDDDDDAPVERIEGERRLFYVAVTRARDELYLYRDDTAELSRFLVEADPDGLVERCEWIRRATEDDPDDLELKDVARLCLAADHLQLGRYLRRRWQPSEKRQTVLRQALDGLDVAMASACQEVEARKADREAYEARRAEHLDPIDEQLRHVDDKKFVLPNVEVPVEPAGEGASSWVGRPVSLRAPDDHEAEPGAPPVVVSGNAEVGQVAYDRDDGSVAREVLEPLAPSYVRGEVVRASSSGRTLYVQIDAGATRRRLEQARKRAVRELDSPADSDEATRLMASDACRRGKEVLKQALASNP